MKRSISRTKAYGSLLKFLTRRKLDNPGLLTTLLFEKFVDSKNPSFYQSIKSEELKSRQIIPSKNCENFLLWRNEMRLKGIIVCMASKNEIFEDNANYKAGMFKYGESIKKYIEAAVLEKSSVVERLDTKSDQSYVLALEERMNARLELHVTKEKVADLELRVSDLETNLEELLLEFLPPDTEERRKIIRKNKHIKSLAIEELKEAHLKIVR